MRHLISERFAAMLTLAVLAIGGLIISAVLFVPCATASPSLGAGQPQLVSHIMGTPGMKVHYVPATSLHSAYYRYTQRPYSLPNCHTAYTVYRHWVPTHTVKATAKHSAYVIYGHWARQHTVRNNC